MGLENSEDGEPQQPTLIVREDMLERISVPAEDDGFFWAVAMAYLLPVSNEEYLFSQRFAKLFTLKNRNGVIAHVQRVLRARSSLETAYQDEVLVELVLKVFRNKVVEQMMKMEVQLLSPSVLVSDREIRAMQSLLNCHIVIFTDDNAEFAIDKFGINIFLFNFDKIHFEFGLIRAQFICKTLKINNSYQLAADYIDLGVNDIDYRDENGDSLSHLAATLSDDNNRNDVMIKRLIGQGAYLNLKNNLNKTPLDVAIDSMLINKDRDMRHTVLHLAIISNHLKVVEDLIQSGVDANTKDYNNKSALHFATEKGHLEIVKAFVEKGKAEVDSRDYTGATPLQRTVKFGYLKVAKYLIESGADVNALDESLASVLTYAARAGHVHIVQYLLENKADMNPVDQRGLTALHHAVECSQWEALICLVELKANLNILDNNNKTVLDGVLEIRKWDLVRYLLENGALLTNLSINQKIDICKRFINESGNNEEQLYQAIKLGNVEILDTALSQQSDEMISHLLAKVYEQLKLHNVKLNRNICLYVENRISDFRFFSSNHIKSEQKEEELSDVGHIKGRLNLVVSCIDQLLTSSEQFDQVNDTFLLTGKFIAQNLQILKRQLSSTLDALPWEEIQFVLLTFLSSYTNHVNGELINALLMYKQRLLSHLKSFRIKLEDLANALSDKDVKEKKKIVRDRAVENISKLSPQFEGLYADFEILKDVYSLKRIEKHIKIAGSVDLETKPLIGQLAIERALQVIGECLKNTVDSPNMSVSVQNMLLKHAPLHVTQIVTSLRNSLSHVNALPSADIGSDPEFYIKMQDDLKKLETEITFILIDKKIRAVKMFLERLSACERIEEMRDMVSEVQSQLQMTIDITEMHSNFDKIQQLVKHLDDVWEEKSEFQTRNFNKIYHILEDYEKKLKQLQMNLVRTLEKLHALISFILVKDNIDVIRNEAFQFLISPVAETYADRSSFYQSLLNAIEQLYKSTENEQLAPLFQLLFYTINFDGKRMKSIERLKFSYEVDGKKINPLNVILDQIDEKIDRFIDEIPDTTTRGSFREEFRNKVEVYTAKTALLKFYEAKNSPEITDETYFIELMGKISFKLQKGEAYSSLYAGKSDDLLSKNVLGRINQRTRESYGSLVKKIAKEPSNAFMQDAYSDFIKSFNAHKKLPKDFISNNKNLFFDGEIYFQKLKSMDYILSDELSDIDLVNLLETKDEARVAIEMLMLTLTEILDNLSLLETNRLFLDAHAPLLIGKNLRNYLAHGDLLIDILSIDHLKSIIFHYRILKVHCDVNNGHVYTKHALIGEVTIEDIPKLRDTYERKLELLKKQEELFIAVQVTNSIERFRSEKRELNCRKSNGWTLLNFAVKTDNVDAFKSLLNNDLNIYQKDVFGYSILYYLPRYGSTRILRYLIDSFSIDLDAKLSFDTTLTHAAAQYNRHDTIELLISNGADLNPLDDTHNTPLYYAIEYGHFDIVVTLLKAGADISHRNQKGQSLLHVAAVAGRVKIAEYLISKGLSVHDISKTRHTPLHYACTYGHENMVDLLLEHEADVNAMTNEDESCLHLAAQRGSERIFQRLLDNGANVHSLDVRGNTVLHVAAFNGFHAIVLTLLKNGAVVETTNNAKMTVLHCASLMGHHDVVKTLLGHGAKVDALADHKAALHMATAHKHRESVKVLLDYKANVDIRTEVGATALHVAAEEGDVDVIDILLAAKSNVNEVDNCGRSPLHYAVDCNQIKAVEVLVRNGAEIDACDDGGNTPLLLATFNGHLPIFEYLRGEKANVFIKNHKSFTPFSTAVFLGYKNIVEKLIAYEDIGKDCENELGKTPLHLAAENGHDDIVKILVLKNGADVNRKLMSNEFTALHSAARYAHDTTVRQLLLMGAEVNAAAINGLTALHLAAEYGHAYVAEILIKYGGAVVDALDVNQQTPLHRASAKGQLGVIRVLCRYKANVNAKDVKTYTALHYAAQNDCCEVIKLLLMNKATVDAALKGGYTALHLAAHNGHTQSVETLLMSHPDVNAESCQGESPLYLAVRFAHFDITRMLIEQEADVFARNSHDSVLHEAVENVDILRLVLAEMKKKCEGDAERLRAAVNVADAEGDTPLMWAVEKGDLRATQLLLECDEIDVDRQNLNGWTALHWAAAGGGHLEIANLLLDKKADADIKDENGERAFDVAYGKISEDQQYETMAALLLSLITTTENL